MKSIKIYCCLLFFSTMFFGLQAQTHIWTGNGDDFFWSDPLNWDVGTIPLVDGIGTVIIPTGVEVRSTSTINFKQGEFRGGGKLINNGTLNFINSSETDNSKIFTNIVIWSETDINVYRAAGISNNDPILLNEGGHIFAGHNGTLTLDGIGITHSTATPGLLEINGPFNKTGIEAITIDVETIICCYEFTVSEGSLVVESNFGNTVLGPSFNVLPNASLVLSGDHKFGYWGGAGIDGIIDGYFEIKSHNNKHPIVQYSVFFTITGVLNLADVTFVGGAGNNPTFHNRMPVVLPEYANVTFENLLFSNQEPMVLNPMSNLILSNGAEFRNGGELILNEAIISGTDNEIFRNHDLITVLGTSPSEVIDIHFCNWNGILDIGESEFLIDDSASFTNYNYQDPLNTMGEVIGSGIFRFPTYDPLTVNNEGRFSPGPQTNVMHCTNFSQSVLGLLTLDVNSLVDFDSIINEGTVYFEGGFDLTLGYEPQIGDEFIVLQSDSPLTNCNPITTTSAEFNGYIYTFDVICNSDNITLKVASITLSIDQFDESSNIFYLIPNPAKNQVELIFSESNPFYESSEIQIYDYAGRLMGNFKDFSVLKNTIDLSSLSSGIYTIQLTVGGKRIEARKLILE